MNKKVLNETVLLDFLNEKYERYNNLAFIESDPISIPHQFKQKEDIEIAAFLSATIAWGQRITIIKNANKLIEMMDHAPYKFIMYATKKERKPFSQFVHRTFNGIDTAFFLESLHNIYTKYGGLEEAFQTALATKRTEDAIMNFRKIFFSIDHPGRTQKHVSNPSENSSAKRLCMFLRWMVRNDKKGVDFGIWNKYLKPGDLMCPLDVHSGNVARKLGILKRVQNDWKAVNELTEQLRKFDPNDPVKYDFALFGLGVFEKF